MKYVLEARHDWRWAVQELRDVGPGFSEVIQRCQQAIVDLYVRLKPHFASLNLHFNFISTSEELRVVSIEIGKHFCWF